jgi:hypothetical protein
MNDAATRIMLDRDAEIPLDAVPSRFMLETLSCTPRRTLRIGDPHKERLPQLTLDDSRIPGLSWFADYYPYRLQCKTAHANQT